MSLCCLVFGIGIVVAFVQDFSPSVIVVKLEQVLVAGGRDDFGCACVVRYCILIIPAVITAVSCTKISQIIFHVCRLQVGVLYNLV